MAHDPDWLRSGDIQYVTARDIIGASPYTMDHLLHEPQVSSGDYGSHMPGVEEVVATGAAGLRRGRTPPKARANSGIQPASQAISPPKLRCPARCRPQS